MSVTLAGESAVDYRQRQPESKYSDSAFLCDESFIKALKQYDLEVTILFWKVQILI